MNYSDYNKIVINGQRLQGSEIISYCRESEQHNLQRLGEFMMEWLNGESVIKLQTSGSTGMPKTIMAEKSQMLQSAAMTSVFFGFKPEQTALLCLPVHYIAGKMMVVRALYSGLNLFCIEPNSTPLSVLPKNIVIDFAPLTPMQLGGVRDMRSVRKILLGGSSVDPTMEEKLQSFETAIYQGYGMTETLSHVAIRRINGIEKTDKYSALPGITFEMDRRGCLIIQAFFLKEKIFTNDVVSLINDQTFIWKGRVDNVINSGGVKVFPEEIEKKISSLIPERYFLAGLPDNRLGDKLTLFIEGEPYKESELKALSVSFSKILERFEKPREIIFVRNFSLTASGKVNRKATIKS